MLLSLGVAGITFSGADVGGFFGNPDAELVTRWYQAAGKYKSKMQEKKFFFSDLLQKIKSILAFQPFYRGHAHLDTKRREPWVFGEPTTTHIRNAIRRRYALLPYWYTLFEENNRT